MVRLPLSDAPTVHVVGEDEEVGGGQLMSANAGWVNSRPAWPRRIATPVRAGGLAVRFLISHPWQAAHGPHRSRVDFYPDADKRPHFFDETSFQVGKTHELAAADTRCFSLATIFGN
jgi:hypothetical protein